ncbi:Lytic transglycosylase catalytic [Burkholderia ambifaria IOP40-10]|uniref:Lytic transglycosylase catalytic n=1 Tax=Burkholderia ambifaria IOP40-10 TaxID=396596 RepID=B1FE04_9BURK|nr:lytic transglycosylase domain-containing protein [Burkholderia ambifaria]EDT04216.1 Lytic transglycosylase catalytic [Burkholderia ambifaria IOP40-10]
MPLDFASLAQQCAPQIPPVLMAAIVRVESGFNPYAIGVVRGRLLRQPSNRAEAVATVRALEAGGWNFSVGLAQINRVNWSAYGVTTENAFEPCRNLAIGAAILQDCLTAARNRRNMQFDAQAALLASLSCYASGNFSTGYRTGYVQRVVNAVASQPPLASSVTGTVPIPVVPIDSAMLTLPPRAPSADKRRQRESSNGVTTVPIADPKNDPGDSAVVF